MGNHMLFVSEIQSMDRAASSTNIMTVSLLRGIKELGVFFTLIGICDPDQDYEALQKEYSAVADRVILLPGKITKSNNKYKHLAKLFYCSFAGHFYQKQMERHLAELGEKPDLILSHSPSIESVLYSDALRRYYPDTPYYQFWSDPIALQGILPNQISLKRLPFRYLEQKLLQKSDRIIYGTQPLMSFQKQVFPALADRMRYVDIPYLIRKPGSKGPTQNNRILYAGNYFQRFRNIFPLIEAMEELPEFTLDIYGEGDRPDRIPENVCFHDRIPPNQLYTLQEQYDTLICLLNVNCIQIPGKLFYDMLRPQRIMVITDGAHADVIKEYLSRFQRFCFATNTKKEIIFEIRNQQTSDAGEAYLQLCSPRAVAEELLKGGAS